MSSLRILAIFIFATTAALGKMGLIAAFYGKGAMDGLIETPGYWLDNILTFFTAAAGTLLVSKWCKKHD